MRPPIAFVALGLLCAAPAAAQLSEPHVVRPSATPCLNVRPEPDTDAEPGTCIPPGTAVTVIGSVPYWREVRLDDGSTGWAVEFIEVVTPEIVVVQSGERPYGGRTLPDDTVLDRYCALDIDTRIVRTDQNDAADGLTAANDEDGDHVVIRTNGSTIEVEALEGGETWQVASC